MDIIIEAPGFTASDNLKELITERVNKLENLAHGAIRADVTLYKGSEGNPENSYCEIRLEMPGNDPFVKKNAESFEMAVADAVDTLQAQLRKNKEKLMDQHRGAPDAVIMDELNNDSDGEVLDELNS